MTPSLITLILSIMSFILVVIFFIKMGINERKVKQLKTEIEQYDYLHKSITHVNKDLWKLQNPPKYKPLDLVWVRDINNPDESIYDKKEMHRVMVIGRDIEKYDYWYLDDGYFYAYTVLDEGRTGVYSETRLYNRINPEEFPDSEYKIIDNISHKIKTR